MLPPNAIGAVPRPVPGEPSRPVRACDDPRFVGLKLVFVIVSRAMSLLVLSRRESWWKDAEILMLRHQLAVAQRERPQAQSRLTWPDRAWLALLAGTLPIERLAAMRLIVTPGTILRWHREILRRRWARLSRRSRSGRPPVRRDVRSVVLRLAMRTVWALPPRPRRAGHARPHGSAVHGLADPQGCGDPPRAAPGRPRLGRVSAILGPRDPGAGLPRRRPAQRHEGLCLAVIEHGTRRIRILGATEHPGQSWVVQQATNLLMDLHDAGTRVRFVLHDRAASFTAAFDEVFHAAGVRIVRSAVQAPRIDSIIERSISSSRRELLDRTLIWNSAASDDRAARVRGLPRHAPAAPRPEPAGHSARCPIASPTWTTSASSGATAPEE